MGICISSESSAIHGSPEEARDEKIVMNKEIKLQENLDCSCSGTTAVFALKEEPRIQRVWDVLSNKEVCSIVWGQKLRKKQHGNTSILLLRLMTALWFASSSTRNHSFLVTNKVAMLLGMLDDRYKL
ncbi:hypothetical protein glysoja_016361 [Glycine soja]|nr:hypothetical protein glysoja_016361 [Glycine soja]